MRRFLATLWLFSLGFLSAHAATPPPNIVFILADDLGATDLGCYGSSFYETPNIDQLARDGIKFTHSYSACPVCSPSRSALMTGRYRAELHLTDFIPGHKRRTAQLNVPDWSMNLTHSVQTLPQALHAAGYVSCAIGKWHLGVEGPEKYGFDVSVANNGGGRPATYFSPYKNPQLPDGPPGEFLSDRLTTEAESSSIKTRTIRSFSIFRITPFTIPSKASRRTSLISRPGFLPKLLNKMQNMPPSSRAWMTVWAACGRRLSYLFLKLRNGDPNTREVTDRLTKELDDSQLVANRQAEKMADSQKAKAKAADSGVRLRRPPEAP